MSRIKNSNFYVVNGWMVNDLKLTGRELQVYAIIYGFTQDDDTEFCGSLNYISDWLGTNSRHTAIRAINNLLARGLITKRQTKINGVAVNYYKVVWPYPLQIENNPQLYKGNMGGGGTIYGSEKASPTGLKDLEKGSAKTAQVVTKVHGGSAKTTQEISAETAQGVSAKTAPNIYTHKDTSKYIDNYLEEAEKAEEDRPEKTDKVPYQKIKDLYNSICKSFSQVITISATRKKAIAARWKEYDGDIAIFETLFTMAEDSSFLKGGNNRRWKATFDWLMKSSNMTKVLEGNYQNKGEQSTTAKEAEPPRAKTQQELEDELRKDGSFKGYPDFNKMFSRKEEPDGSGIETP